MGETEYRLKDQSTGFYDSETGFTILRDQQRPLGEDVGWATREAIEHGRLVAIPAQNVKAAVESGEPTPSPAPADSPSSEGRKPRSPRAKANKAGKE